MATKQTKNKKGAKSSKKAKNDEVTVDEFVDGMVSMTTEELISEDEKLKEAAAHKAEKAEQTCEKETVNVAAEENGHHDESEDGVNTPSDDGENANDEGAVAISEEAAPVENSEENKTEDMTAKNDDNGRAEPDPVKKKVPVRPKDNKPKSVYIGGNSGGHYWMGQIFEGW